MIQGKRKLQVYTSAALAALILCLGLLSAGYAIRLLRSTLEQQMAEDNRIIGENLRIIISQAAREYTDRDSSLVHTQKVLETLSRKGWIGFACVLDKSGRVLAHPRREFLDTQIPLETYVPTPLSGLMSPGLDELRRREDVSAGIYRTSADIIAVH